ncbi:MAG: OmpA family protein [Gallionella sp.]|nr:OmpA family protein [Gallionella sp.]
MKTTSKIVAIACFLSVAQLAAAHPTSIGYLYDSNGNIVRNSFGECWRTAEWAKDNAVVECDPALFKKGEPPVAEKKSEALAVALRADESFDLGKAELKPDARVRLSQLAKQLQTLSYDMVFITGHADRSGSAAANQLLSERRANAVHNFLVSEGVAADKISSIGKGSSEPVTRSGECEKVKRPQLAACLAPDRRVEIRVPSARSK